MNLKSIKDSFFGTLVVAVLLCLVCSLLVAGSSQALKGMQERNAKLKKQRNVLEAAGLYDPANPLSGDQIEAEFAKVETVAVNLDDGSLNEGIDVATYDPDEAAKTDGERALATGTPPLKGFVFREKVALAYLFKSESGNLDKVVLPVYGKGLWSTMKGFIALDSDLKTISGLTFYSHGETPGLGGEIDNTRWKAQWKGEIALDETGKPQMKVVKGGALPDDKSAVDGLSGATITSNGVQNLVNYWLGPDAFGPFLKTLQSNESMAAVSERQSATVAAK